MRVCRTLLHKVIEKGPFFKFTMNTGKQMPDEEFHQPISSRSRDPRLGKRMNPAAVPEGEDDDSVFSGI